MAQWDIVDVSRLRENRSRSDVQDTLARKVNTSDASEYATMIGCCSSKFWGGSSQVQADIRRVLAVTICAV